MPSPTIETLLILQDRDTKRLGIEAQLKAVPREIGAVGQAKIAGEKAAIEAARTEIKELETKKKLLETEIGSAEDQAGQIQDPAALGAQKRGISGPWPRDRDDPETDR